MLNWYSKFIKQCSWENVDPRSGKPVWQIHLDKYFEYLGRGRDLDNRQKKDIFSQWMNTVSDNAPELINNNELEPRFKQQVRDYLMQTKEFDPFEGGRSPSPKTIWQIHLDMFFKVSRRVSPELADPEFDTGEGEYAINEKKMSMFRQWLDEAKYEFPEMFHNGELKLSFKQQVKDYVIKTEQFDPFQDDEGEELPPVGRNRVPVRHEPVLDIDDILEKISREGIGSLTLNEKELLEKARQARINQRR